uniref:Uncharacterized protein n=1 Tax=Caenorhabditis tropicalis TaxID=1561998 RepID=A0A1I7THN7_9PELO
MQETSKNEESITEIKLVTLFVRMLSNPGSAARCLFTCQLNTCALELQPINSEGYSVVRLHKEELDLIFNDKKIDNRVTVELVVSHTSGPTTIATAAVQSVHSLLPRNNSYETFEVAQGEMLFY